MRPSSIELEIDAAAIDKNNDMPKYLLRAFSGRPKKLAVFQEMNNKNALKFPNL